MTPEIRSLSPGAPGYPSRLLELKKPPEVIHVAGEMSSAPVIGVVGTRKPSPDADGFARELASPGERSASTPRHTRGPSTRAARPGSWRRRGPKKSFPRTTLRSSSAFSFAEES
jgi:DNA recombination-mediator protein A